MRPKLLFLILLATIGLACGGDADDEEDVPTEEGYVLPPDFPDQGPHTNVVVEPGT